MKPLISNYDVCIPVGAPGRCLYPSGRLEVGLAEAHRGGHFTAADVENRLSEAGRVLLALPWSGCFPAGFRSLFWPDQVGPSPGRRVPTSHEITAMDEAYLWVAFITDQEERRLVLMRSLVLDDLPSGRPRYLWTWRRLQRLTGLHPDTLKARWGRGIDRIVRGLRGAPAGVSRRPAGFALGLARKPAGKLSVGLHDRPGHSSTAHLLQI